MMRLRMGCLDEGAIKDIISGEGALQITHILKHRDKLKR